MATTEQQRIVVVDGYSTGRELTRELVDRNVECLHLQSTEEVPAGVAKSFDRRPFDADLGYLGNAEVAAGVLADFAPDAVVAGSEWGVTFAETIAHRLGLPTNEIATLGARRDKFAMIEAVGRKGLLVPEQAVVTAPETAHAFAERHGKWPIVVKPMSSAGSDGVSICRSHADIDAAFAKAYGVENLIGCLNDRLVVQSYLSGPQYIVNTVSRDGVHRVTDCWHMPTLRRPGAELVPDRIRLLNPNLPTTQALIDYTLGAIDALGIRNGAAHSELKWTPDGPALIEVNARIMGAAMDEPSYAAAGMQTQAAAFATALAGSEAERQALFAEPNYRLGKHMSKVLFSFDEPGIVRSTAGLARLEELASFHAHYRGLKQGARVWKTSDTLCCGGVVYLVHEDAWQIERDLERLRRWERDGELYEVAAFDDATGERASARGGR